MPQVEHVITSKPTLELLGTLGCHLCDVAEKLVRKVAYPLGFSISIVEIADNEALLEEYGMRIPVIKSGSAEVLNWPFDEEQLLEWLKAL